MSLAGQNQCQDKTLRVGKFWVDSMNFDCTLYEGARWCTSSGGYGTGWNSNDGGGDEKYWEPFSGFRRQGKDAPNACCGCGGGNRNPRQFDNTLRIYRPVETYPYANVSFQFTKIHLPNALHNIIYIK